MTRNRKIDPEVLKREYIFDAATPPISIQRLADRHGLAKNTVAEKAIKGGWYKLRIAHRESMAIKVTDALGDEWVKFESANRESLLALGQKYLKRYTEALDAGEIKVSTRDMLGVAAMMRTFSADAAAAKTDEGEELLDEDSDLSPAAARQLLARIERSGALEAPAEAGSEGAGED